MDRDVKQFLHLLIYFYYYMNTIGSVTALSQINVKACEVFKHAEI